MSNYRYELKYILSKDDAAFLKKQLFLVCSLDPHSVSSDYSYYIRSLYFDDPFKTAYFDKVNGEIIRNKYRIRAYNFDFSRIKLEAKHKDYNMTRKEEESISASVCRLLIDKNCDYIDYMQYMQSGMQSSGPLLSRFITEVKINGLAPAVLVDYRRTAFTYPVSDVRITFDEDIRSGRNNFDFFDRNTDSLGISHDNISEIEVKFNDFIPEHLQMVLKSVPVSRTAISKFALCCGIK